LFTCSQVLGSLLASVIESGRLVVTPAGYAMHRVPPDGE
jgi:hypothetical protein